MGDGFFYGGHLRTHTLPVTGDAGKALARKDALTSQLQLATMPDLPGDLFEDRPGWRISLDADAAANGQLIPVGRGLADAMDAARGLPRLSAFARVPLSGDPNASANASLSILFTPRHKGRMSATLGVQVQGGGGVEADGAGAMIDPRRYAGQEAAKFRDKTLAAIEYAKYAMAYMTSSLEVQRVLQLLRDPNRDPDELKAASFPVLTFLAEANRRARNADPDFATADTIFAATETDIAAKDAHGGTRGAATIDETFRAKLIDRHVGQTRVRLTTAARATVIAPISNPGGDDKLRSLLFSIDTNTSVAFNGVRDLRGAVAEARDVVREVAELTGELLYNPQLLSDPNAVAGLQAQAEALAPRGAELAKRLQTLYDLTYADLGFGMRINQATQPGFALSAAGVSVDATHPAGYSARLSLRARNLAGRLPGLVTEYRLFGQDGKPRPTASDRKREDVYRTLFPIGGSADLRLGWKGLELRGGLDLSTGGVSTYAAAAFTRGRWYAGAGVVMPKGLPTTGRASLGVKLGQAQLTLSGGGDEALNSANAGLDFTWNR